MLDARGRRLAIRYAHRDRAVVVAPAQRHRGIGARRQAPKAVVARDEEKRRLGHRLEEAGDGLRSCRAPSSAAAKTLLAVPAKQAAMNVHARAGTVEVGLRHEGGAQAMLAGDTLDEATQQHRVVGRGDGVGAMVQVDLELARRRLGDDAVGRQALDAGRRRASLAERRANSSRSDIAYMFCREGPPSRWKTVSGAPSGPRSAFSR